MDWTLIAAVSSLLLNAIVIGFWKPWLGAYGSEKGKNLARKEDIDKIIDEIAKVTRTQEQIKTELAGDLWNKQMLWTEKKLVYGGMLTAIHDMLTHVNEMRACVDINPHELTQEKQAEINSRMKDVTLAFLKAERELLRTTRLAGIFAKPECYAYLVQTLSVQRQQDWAEPRKLYELFVRIATIDTQLMKYAQEDLGIVPLAVSTIA